VNDWDDETEVMTPDEQVMMYRTMQGAGGVLTETVTFSRYDADRWLIAAYPRVQMREGGEFVGTTNEWPIPKDQDAALFMTRRIAKFRMEGWIVTDLAAIDLRPRVAEPWEIADPMDGPVPF
jgi:hypothetical protein